MGEWLVPKVDQDPALQKLSWSASHLLDVMDWESLSQADAVVVKELKRPQEAIVQLLSRVTKNAQTIYEDFVKLVDYNHDTWYPPLILLDDSMSKRWMKAGKIVEFAPFTQEFLLSTTSLRDSAYALSRGEPLADTTQTLTELEADLTAQFVQKIMETNRVCNWITESTHAFGTTTTQYFGIEDFGSTEFLEAARTFDGITLYRATSAFPTPVYIRETQPFTNQEVLRIDAIPQDAITHISRSVSYRERFKTNSGEEAQKLRKSILNNKLLKELQLLDEPECIQNLADTFYIFTPVTIFVPPSYLKIFGEWYGSQGQELPLHIDSWEKTIYPWIYTKVTNEIDKRSNQEIGVNIQGLLGVYDNLYFRAVELPTACKRDANYKNLWLDNLDVPEDPLKLALTKYNIPNSVTVPDKIRRRDLLNIEATVTELVLPMLVEA